MKRKMVLSFLALVGACQAAVTIGWQSDLTLINAQSDGVTGLDPSFKFEIGTFVGLTPDATNLASWGNAWRSFGSATYQVGAPGDRFSGSQVLNSNAAPFTTTARVYIWGKNGSAPGSEWILIGKPTWFWPIASPGGPPPFPVEFQVSSTSGNDAILGSVNMGSLHMKTAVADFALTYEAWVSQVFSEGDNSDRNGDFDGDGRSNFLEYALGSNPKTKDQPFRVALGSNFEIEVPRARYRAVNWVLKTSTNLTGFTPMASGFEISVNEPGRLVFKLTGLPTGKRFFLVEATAP